ncbi:MAG: hypothetical protein ACE364_06875 [Chlorobiota bacterium]
MRKLSFLVVSVIMLFLFSCKDNSMNQEADAENLARMFEEIKGLSNSEPCEDPSEWRYTSYGSKACGGPIGYIAYSENIDTTLFLSLVAEHKEAEDEYNKRWGIISDCSLPEEPVGVECNNGEPKLVYSN